MYNPLFDLKFVVTLALAISAIAIGLHLSRPQASLRGWAWLLLIPAGLLPAVIGLAGPLYFGGALVLGLIYLLSAVRFWAGVSDATARRLQLVGMPVCLHKVAVSEHTADVIDRIAAAA